MRQALYDIPCRRNTEVLVRLCSAQWCKLMSLAVHYEKRTEPDLLELSIVMARCSVCLGYVY